MGRDRSPEQVPDQVGDWNKRRGREAPPLVVFAAAESRAGPRSGAGTGKWVAGTAKAGPRSSRGRVQWTFETVSVCSFVLCWGVILALLPSWVACAGCTREDFCDAVDSYVAW